MELAFSVHPNTLRPHAPTVILACAANVNGHSSRDLAPGDAITFEFTRGSVIDCLGVELALDADSMSAADWACSVDGGVVSLTYQGDGEAWGPGQAVCGKLILAAEDRPTTVLTAATTARVSTVAPGISAALVLGVASDIGIPGPVGPEGPAGPVGAAGAGGVGQRAMVHSTGQALAVTGGPPVPVPGLRIDIELTPGAQLLLLMDTASWDCLVSRGDLDAYVYLELNGEIIAMRGLSNTGDDVFKSTTLAYLTDPLAAGHHIVRGMASGWDAPVAGAPLQCIGRDAPPGHLGSLRLIALEVLP